MQNLFAHSQKKIGSQVLICNSAVLYPHYLTRAVTSPTSDPGKGVLGVVSRVLCPMSHVACAKDLQLFSDSST